MSIGVQAWFETLISIILGIYPEVELPDHMVILCLVFVGTATPFSHSGFTILHPQQCTRVPIFLHSGQSLFSIFSFYNNHANGCAVVFHWGFDVHFPNDS